MVDSTVNLVFISVDCCDWNPQADRSIIARMLWCWIQFCGRLLDRTVQTDLCLVLSKPAVYSSKLQKNKKKGGGWGGLNCLCTVTCIQHIVSDLRALWLIINSWSALKCACRVQVIGGFPYQVVNLNQVLEKPCINAN